MILKIYDAIMHEDNRKFMQFMGFDGVSFRSIDDFISAIPDDDDVIDMRINCPGGEIIEGWSIIDKLLATGKRIKATVEGEASSMASLLLLAASERKGYRHASMLLHNSRFIDIPGPRTAEDLDRLSERLKEDDRRALDFIVERTGANREEVQALMDAETRIDMEKAKELGFIHEILEPASAIDTNRLNNMSNKKTIASALKAFAEAIGLSVKMEAEAPEAVSLVLTSQDGTEINVEREEGDPQVGDAASPDGEHLMPDGTTIVIADGVITEIRDAAAEDQTEDGAEDNANDSEGAPAEALASEDTEATAEATDETAALNAQIAEQTETIAALQARVAELEASQLSAEQSAILAKVDKAGGVAWLDKATQSSYTPAKRQRQEKTTPPAGCSKTSAALAEARARKEAKRKSVLRDKTE